MPTYVCVVKAGLLNNLQKPASSGSGSCLVLYRR